MKTPVTSAKREAPSVFASVASLIDLSQFVYCISTDVRKDHKTVSLAKLSGSGPIALAHATVDEVLYLTINLTESRDTDQITAYDHSYADSSGSAWQRRTWREGRRRGREIVVLPAVGDLACNTRQISEDCLLYTSPSPRDS